MNDRYPFAGAANAVVRLAVVSVGDQKTIWLDLAKVMGMSIENDTTALGAKLRNECRT